MTTMNDKPPDNGKSPPNLSAENANKGSRPVGSKLRRWLSFRQHSPAPPNGTSLEAMTEALLQLNTKQVRDIMVPRSRVVFVYEDEGRDEILDRIIKSGFTRLPVADEGEQKILGILHAKDLLRNDIEGTGKTDPKSLMRVIAPVPESMRVLRLLEVLRERRLHMAPVVDEYGGISGIVTIEDIIEEVIGEIEDEHDKEEIEKITALQKNQWRIQGNIPMEEFNEYFGTSWEDKDADTLGGLVVNLLGRIPKSGSTMTVDDFELVVEAVTRGSIRSLLLSATKGAPPAAKSPAPDADEEC